MNRMTAATISAGATTRAPAGTASPPNRALTMPPPTATSTKKKVPSTSENSRRPGPARIEASRSSPRRAVGGAAGPGDGVGEVPAAADERPPPRRDALDLDLEREAEEGPDQHDQREDRHALHGRLDGHRAHQV